MYHLSEIRKQEMKQTYSKSADYMLHLLLFFL